MNTSLRNTLIGLGTVAVIILIIYSLFAGNYNKMVNADEAVMSQWGQVQNVYQRRYDLIPNLVRVVGEYASHEKEVFAQVTEARSKAGGVINVSSDILDDPEAFSRFQQVQGELGTALQRLMAITENYPDLKASQNFLALQDQLEGTENRITVERQRYNDAVRVYNALIRRFPQNLLAGRYGFTQKAYFAADNSAQTAPKIEFK